MRRADAGFETENEGTISQREKNGEEGRKSDICRSIVCHVLFWSYNELILHLKKKIGIVYVIPQPRNFGQTLEEKKRKNFETFLTNT